MKHLFDKYFTSAALLILLLLFILSSAVILYNKEVMTEAVRSRERSVLTFWRAKELYNGLQQMDLSIRSYALMQTSEHLTLSLSDAHKSNRKHEQALDSLFALQDIREISSYEQVKISILQYEDLYERLIKMVGQGDLDGVKAQLAESKNAAVFAAYKVFLSELRYILRQHKEYSELRAEKAEIMADLFSVMVILLSFPLLAIVWARMSKSSRNQKAWMSSLQKTNEAYLFSDGQEDKVLSPEQVLSLSIENLKKASMFVTHITEGKYDITWDGLSDENKKINRDNLAGRLVEMRDQMIKVKKEDDRRMWANEGLARFSEILRQYQHSDVKVLADEVLAFIIKYLHSQQGSFFLFVDRNEDDKHLQLLSCYAFDKKKIIERRIEIGEGLAGQVCLDGKTVFLTEIPDQYPYISSGLGGATPTCLLIVPVKFSEKIEAVIELASFKEYEAHEIAFIEKAAEYIASSIATAQVKADTEYLLNQQMMAQEEEMRKYIEGMMKTQEDLAQRERKYRERLEEIQGFSAEE